MKILNLYPGNKFDGPFKYRNYTPFKQLKSRGHEVQLGDRPATSVDADIIVLNRALFPRLSEHIRGLKRYTNVKLVYDTDDLLWAISPSNICSSRTDNTKFLRYMEDFKDLIDAVTTTTEHLAGEVRKFIPGKPVYVLPNSVYPGEWELRRGGNLVPTIGYSGSFSHLEDLLLVAPVLVDLQDRYGFDFELLGFGEDLLGDIRELHKRYPGWSKPEWVKIAFKLEPYLEKLEFSCQPCDGKFYPKQLASANWDIGICPLVDNRFNRCKSNIKFYEYSLVGTACLASNVLPYKTEVPSEFLVENTYAAWYNALDKLILAWDTDEDLEARIMANRAWVLEHRNIEKTVQLWEDLYHSLIQENEPCLSAK